MIVQPGKQRAARGIEHRLAYLAFESRTRGCDASILDSHIDGAPAFDLGPSNQHPAENSRAMAGGVAPQWPGALGCCARARCQDGLGYPRRRKPPKRFPAQRSPRFGAATLRRTTGARRGAGPNDIACETTPRSATSSKTPPPARQLASAATAAWSPVSGSAIASPQKSGACVAPRVEGAGFAEPSPPRRSGSRSVKPAATAASSPNATHSASGGWRP